MPLTCIGVLPGGRGPAPAYLDPARDLIPSRARHDAVIGGGASPRLLAGPPVEAGQQACHLGQQVCPGTCYLPQFLHGGRGFRLGGFPPRRVPLRRAQLAGPR